MLNVKTVTEDRQRIDSVMPGLLGADEAVRSARDDLQNRVGRSKRSAVR